MSTGHTSGEIYFNPAYSPSLENVVGYYESKNVIPLEVVNETSSSRFKSDDYQEAEFLSKKKKNEEKEEEDVYTSQLLLFLKQNNLLKNSREDENTQKPSRTTNVDNDSDT